jgi:hypothetical protein
MEDETRSKFRQLYQPLVQLLEHVHDLSVIRIGMLP